MRASIAFCILIAVMGFIGEALSQAAPAPQWRTLGTEAHPKKRDDIFFADASTGFYGTGKGNLYRTEDAVQQRIVKTTDEGEHWVEMPPLFRV